MNIFFYSADCKYCYKLMGLLKNLNILKNFKLVLTDNNENIPSYIESVPTLVVNGHPKILVADDAFKWVKNIMIIQKNNEERKNNSEIQNKKNIHIMSELINCQSSNNEPTNVEQNNFSNLFTFVDNNIDVENNYFINPKQKINSIFTGQEFDKIDLNEQKQLLDEQIKIREEQDIKNKQYMAQFIDNDLLKK